MQEKTAPKYTRRFDSFGIGRSTVNVEESKPKSKVSTFLRDKSFDLLEFLGSMKRKAQE